MAYDGYTLIDVQRDGPLVTATVNNPPINLITMALFGELARLAELRETWRQRCWPVPPGTGWALVEKGTDQAIETWEGRERSRGERQEPEQALCFGVELSGSALLASGEVAAQAEILLAPLREQLP